jgi:hypothetical protein
MDWGTGCSVMTTMFEGAHCECAAGMASMLQTNSPTTTPHFVTFISRFSLRPETNPPVPNQCGR